MSRTSSRGTRRLLGVVAASVLVAAPFAIASPAHAATSGFAYVWANAPSTAFYTPAAAYNYNSPAGGAAINKIERTAPGSYRVTLPKLGLAGGMVHVTAYGTTANTCNVDQWYPQYDDQVVEVRCRNTAAQLADTQFTLSYVNKPGGRKIGYAWVGPTGYVNPLYAYSSGGGTVTATRLGVGYYLVTFPNLVDQHGNVQVTAYRGATRCKVDNWGPSGGTSELVRVRCFDFLGNPKDNHFDVTFTAGTGVLGITPAAYGWGLSTGSILHALNATGLALVPGVVGRYRMLAPSMPLSQGTVHVTAFGWRPDYCSVVYWNTYDGVVYQCRDTKGVPIASNANIAFQF